MRSLRDIYARTGDDDKMLELTAKIEVRQMKLGTGTTLSLLFQYNLP